MITKIVSCLLFMQRNYPHVIRSFEITASSVVSLATIVLKGIILKFENLTISVIFMHHHLFGLYLLRLPIIALLMATFKPRCAILPFDVRFVPKY